MRWIALNSQVDSRAQDDWLERELQSAETRRARFRVVLSHIPPFMEYWEAAQWPAERHWGQQVRARWVPLFEQLGVHWVISGHQHRYQRGRRNGIVYTVLGGGGGQLDRDRVHHWPGLYAVDLDAHHLARLDVHADRLEWRVLDADGRQLDEIVLR